MVLWKQKSGNNYHRQVKCIQGRYQRYPSWKDSTAQQFPINSHKVTLISHDNSGNWNFLNSNKQSTEGKPQNGGYGEEVISQTCS